MIHVLHRGIKFLDLFDDWLFYNLLFNYIDSDRAQVTTDKRHAAHLVKLIHK